MIEEAGSESESEDVASDSASSLDDIAAADQSDSEVVSQERVHEGDEAATGFSTISLASLKEDIEKGKAAKQQIGKSVTLLKLGLEIERRC